LFRKVKAFTENGKRAYIEEYNPTCTSG